ncbi:DNA polymerase III subunit gamma and tau [Saccharothrix algeriensis]|uniref:DNA polymerase III subunit gamma/tau n=2 Tax=Saccharothrix algeriensis TaxID=173560 RepID=A0ABS2S8F9_9PSEU|nr:DNA polymerase III subunit gamma and tau [Saccharothrix algeriensis]MBM7811964.1 DNA polymerase-3 subunit gamma/tau [Saccharothrix algeriensis]
MALALYRKYRPATFAEVVGQEHVTDPLRTALGAGRVNHAYLFSGPRGCGKTSSARILARSLNCASGPTPDPCGECNSCVGLAPNGAGSVDVVELDAASHGGVDDARELRDKAFFAPAESRYRVFIIDEAHMVTTQGFNALLKIVEEPPEHLIFIFATTEPDKVLPTIRSRTHHYPFRLIPPSAMRALLERNCAAEGVAVQPSVFPLVIRAGGGSARDTQSVMDQLLSGAGPEGVTYERAIALLGVTDVALIDDVVDGLAAGDGSAVFGTIDRLVDAGHDPRRFASDLLDRLRDLVLLHAVPDAAERGLVSAPDDVVARMAEQRAATRPATVTRWAEVLHQGLTDMRGSTAPRLLLELVAARMLLPSASDAESAVLQRVERLEKYGAPVGGPAPGGAAPGGAAPGGAVAGGESGRTFQRPSQRAAAPAAEGEGRSASAPGGPRPPAAPERGAGPVQHAPAPSAPAPSASGQPASGQPAPAPSTAAPSTAGQSTPGQSTPERSTPAGAPGSAGSPPGPPAQADPGPPPVDRDGSPAGRPGAAPAGDRGGPAAGGAASSVDHRGGSPANPPGGAPPAGGSGAERPVEQPGPVSGLVSGADAAEIRKRWPELCGIVRGIAGPSAGALLTSATVAAVDGTSVTVSHISAPLARRLAEQRNVDAIAAAFSRVFGGTWQVGCVHGEPGAAPARSAPPARQQRSAPTRPSQAARAAAPTRQAPPARPAPVDDVPPPPEPPDPDEPLPPEPVDEEEMLAEAARPGEAGEALDPETAVLKLLADELGARPLKG